MEKKEVKPIPSHRTPTHEAVAVIMAGLELQIN